MSPQPPRSEARPSPDRISAPSLSLPPGGGAIRGLGDGARSLDFTGAAAFSVPIPAPPARGLSPSLGLAYQSSGGNGIFGLGFGIALPNIVRKTSSGIPRYDGGDIFILAGEGDLVPIGAVDRQSGAGAWVADRRDLPAGTPAWRVSGYRPRHEGSFSRIEHWRSLTGPDAHWRVLTRDNVEHLYGLTENSRIADPDQPGRIFQWLIDETRNAVGERIRYHYKAENADALPTTASETGRDHRANRYVSGIEYGNYWHGREERFAFRIAFDYGEYSLDQPEAAPGTWAIRPDSFSSYRSGFEIRTLRRCRNVLIYHCFHDRFGGTPVLTRALTLDYGKPPAAGAAPRPSMLAQLTETGFRKQDDGSYRRKAMPPLTFTFAEFNPAAQAYDLLRVGTQASIPGYLAGGYQLIDIEGDGIPGLLYSDSATTLQWRPLGGGVYAEPQTPARFPFEGPLQGRDVAMVSLAGNGEKDLMVSETTRRGFYRYAGAGMWDAFRPFPAAPVDLGQPEAEMVDLNGDGRADLLVLGEGRIRSYPSLGHDGYGAPEETVPPPDFPLATAGGGEEVLTFADMFGDGLQHCVRITNGAVECWPCLGFGRFGAKLQFGGAPVFEGELDATRLYLVDVDGSGPADIVYVGAGEIQIFFNDSGNGFSAPLTIPLPAAYDNLSQISFADINGNGTSCLVLTRVSPQPTHYYYDFSGGVKPYLLSCIDNHLGSVTLIDYSTSVRQHLADREAGHDWGTRLFFPVHVVERIETRDAIAGVRHVSRYKYHDGYYDPVECEFRGFGFIETWDTEEWDDYRTALKAANVSAAELSEELYVPPIQTRSWYHTGAPRPAGLAPSCAAVCWRGDSDAVAMADNLLAPEIVAAGGETLRQANIAVAGQMLRQEIFGLDNSSAAAIPHKVSETRVEVRLIQPATDRHYAVFRVQPLESLDYAYDRNPADPRISHEIALVVDDYGNVLRSCAIAYPRRADVATVACPEQAQLHAVLNEQAVINHPDSDAEPYRRIGVGYDSRSSELLGLAPGAARFSRGELAAQTEDALANRLAFNQPVTAGKRAARLMSWSRSLFWDPAQAAALLPGQTTALGLLHHIEQTVTTPEQMQAAFAGKGDPDRLAEDAGYLLDQGYWWNRGLIQRYVDDPARFCLPCQTDGLFPGVDPEARLNPTTVIGYDDYGLLPVRRTEYLKGMPATTGGEPSAGAVVLSTMADNDYVVLGAAAVTDANGMVSAALYDPLGMVIATSIMGQEDGQPAGDAPLTGFQILDDASFQDVVDNPAKYLQQASSFFFYDLSAWAERQQPAAAVGLRRQLHVRQLASGAASPIEIGVAFTGGFGNLVEEKRKTGASGSEAWVVSGRTVFNNKGKPSLQYLPFFSDTAAYENRSVANPGFGPPRPCSTTMRWGG